MKNSDSAREKRHMQKTIHPSVANGLVTAPPGKSMTQRAIAAALLARGTTTLIHPSDCDDSMAALEMIRKLGAEVVPVGDEITVLGRISDPKPAAELR